MARISTLETVSNWQALAKDAKYCVKAVAVRVAVSVRALEQFFKRRFGKPPLQMFTLWMAEQADEKVKEGMKGKEFNKDMGYSHHSHLTRALMNARGHGLRRDRKWRQG